MLPMLPAHSSLQQLRTVLKPSMSCSAPNTTTFAALRPAVVLGTCAHAWANGAAAGVPSATAAVPATLVFAVADAARRSTAAAAPTRSQRRVCMNFPSVLFGAGSWISGWHPGPGRYGTGDPAACPAGSTRRSPPRWVHKAVGSQLTCVFVDTGLLRAGKERTKVENHLPGAVQRRHGARQGAGDRFLGALDDIQDPEHKRKIIGETFIRVFEEAASDLGDARFLVQGTLYPDIVESGTKEHGEDQVPPQRGGGLPDDMQFELVEPLQRPVPGRVNRRWGRATRPARGDRVAPAVPPGQGLAVRIVGTVTAERVTILRAADAVVTEEVRRAGLYRELWPELRHPPRGPCRQG